MTPGSPLHVLVVARWYPAWDDPGRGSFVADHVRALVAAGERVTVASFDPTGVRGVEPTRPERAAAAAAALAPALGRPDALATPHAWGAGVPVARLPTILDGARRDPAEVVDAHARALLPFGRGLAHGAPIDLVHAHTGLPDGLAAARLADELGVPLLTTEHSSTAADELADPVAVALYRELLAGRHRLVAVGPGLAAELAGCLGAPAGSIAVLPNAVPVADFPPGPVGGRDPDELLFVGARKASKGVELLLRTLALLRAGRPGLRLRVVGPPGPADDEGRWQALIGELGLADAVTLEGQATRSEVAAAMRRAAVFVHPSPRETFGVVAVEALASGLPVVATPSGGVEAIVADPALGEIAAGHDPAALAAAALRLLERRTGSDPTAMHARMTEAYAADAVAARTLAHYRELLATGPTGSTPPTGSTRPAGRRAADAAAPHGLAAPTDPERWAPPLVVGLSRELVADRLARLPEAIRAGLTVVTSPGREPLDAGLVRGWVEADPERAYLDRLAELGGPIPRGRLAHLAQALRSPRKERERRAHIADRAGFRRARLASLILEAWEGAGRPRWILALDADDVIAAAPVAGGSAPSLAPGGLRWVVDGWDALGRPDPRTTEGGAPD